MERNTLILTAIGAALLAVLAICGTVLVLHFVEPGMGRVGAGGAGEVRGPGIDGEAFFVRGEEVFPIAGERVTLVPVGFLEALEAEQERVRELREQITMLRSEIERVEQDNNQIESHMVRRDQLRALVSHWETETSRISNVSDDFARMGYNAFSFHNPISGKTVHISYAESPPGTDFQLWKGNVQNLLRRLLESCSEELARQRNLLDEHLSLVDDAQAEEVSQRLADMRKELDQKEKLVLPGFELAGLLLSRITPEALTVTGSDGRFRLNAPPGDYELVMLRVEQRGRPEYYFWVVPVTIPETGRAEIVLSQANRGL